MIHLNLINFFSNLKATLGPNNFTNFTEICLKSNHRKLLVWDVKEEKTKKSAYTLVCDLCSKEFSDMSTKISKGAFNYCSFNCFKKSISREKG